MKLIGSTDGKKVIASMSSYDCVSCGELLRDGGQPATNMYAGYTRGYGKVVCFEVPQDFSELYYDYNCNHKNRKYGIWNIEDVKILEKEDWPDFDSMEEKAENFIWGTRGEYGDQPIKYVLLKNCSLDHLKAIIKTQRSIHEETKKVIKYLIGKKS